MSGKKLGTSVSVFWCVRLVAVCIGMGAADVVGAQNDPIDQGSRADRLRAMIDGVREIPPEDAETVTGPAWIYENQQSFRITYDAGFDFEGNLYVAGENIGPPNVGAFIEVFDGTGIDTEPAGPKWAIYNPITDGAVGVQSCVGIEVTPEGELFALITKGVQNGPHETEVRKYLASSGGEIGSFQYRSVADFVPVALDQVPGGGVVILGYEFTKDPPSTTAALTALDPTTGVPLWQWRSENGGAGAGADIGSSFITVDSRGDIYAATFVDRALYLSKVSGASGQDLWLSPLPLFEAPAGLGLLRTQVRVDREGRVVVVSGYGTGSEDETGHLVVTHVGRDGEVSWQYTTNIVPSGYGADPGIGIEPSWVELDDDGNVYVLFYVQERRPGVLKLTPEVPSVGQPKVPVWVQNQDVDAGGLSSSAFGSIAVEARLGGVYAYGNRGGRDWLARLDKESGAVDWELETEPDSRYVLPFRVVVDGGGGVYGFGEYDDVSFNSSSRIIKVRQPTPEDPTFAMGCPTLTTENRSIWAPGVGLLEKSDEFDVLPNSIKDIEFGLGGTVNTFLLGSWGAGIDFDFFVDPRVGYRAEVDGGSVDVHLPIDITWEIPPQVSIRPDMPVTIDVSYSVDPAARMTTCFKPTVDAGLTGSFDGSARIDAYAEAGVFGTLFNDTLVSSSTSVPQQYLPFLSIGWWLDFLGFSQDGSWNEYTDALYRIKFRTPKLEAQAPFDPATQSFTAVPRDTSQAMTNRVFIAAANITEILLTLTNAPIVTNISFQICIENLCLNLGAALFQFFLNMNVDLEQEIKVDDVTAWVRYEFSDGQSPIIQPLDMPLTFTMPSQGSIGGMATAAEVIVTPTVFARSSMSNRTSLDFVPGYTFETLSLSASANYRSWELFSESTTLGVLDGDFGSIGGLELFPNALFPDPWALNLPDGVNISTGQRGIRLAPFVVTARVEDQPTLIGASRSKLDLYIYDQTSPSPAVFNGIAGRTSRFILYGRDFYPVDDPEPLLRPRVMISHAGRTEALQFTRINFDTILVDLPNRFRVVPGVARIWVENDLGCSETVDLPIEFPIPVLDTVNPNLWAADPDLLTIPIQVIDQKTILGSDTFITRRDYYILLRDELWNSLSVGGLSANEYFPDFNFNQLPQFPAVYFGGMPLARFAQPVDNGIYNLRLSEANFDRPRSVPVFICNPGPGGGVSEALDLTIAAPLPVLDRTEPDRIEPGGLGLTFTDDATFTMIVRGPEHVPTFGGFEEPKYGNFNADSVVYFDGEYDAATNSMIGGFALTTEYIDSSELRVDVPIQLVQHPGSHHVRVFTPDNGTEYFEELWTDADFDGVPDRFTDDDGDGVPDDRVFQGFLPSGGASAPLLLRVEYEAPIIHMLSQVESVQNNPVFDTTGPDNVPYYNLSVIGEYFRDGAVVLVDGEPRDTEFVSRGMVRCHMIADDVAIPGVRQIVVQNPGVDGDQTESLEFLVTPAPSRVPSLHARSP